MKTILPFLIVPLLVTCCKDKDQAGDWAAENAAAAVAEAKELKALNAKLKESLRKERERSAELEAQLTSLAVNSQKLIDSTRALSAIQKGLEIAEEAQAEAAPPAPMTAEQKLAAFEAGGIAGVDAQVGRAIVQKAKNQSSAFMAVFEIEREAKGWMTVQAFATTTTQMPTKVRDEIVASAKREHPGSWSMMANELNRDVEAWTTLDEWKKTNVPGLDRQQSIKVIDAAVARYPDDWSMALFVINDEVKRLTK